MEIPDIVIAPLRFRGLQTKRKKFHLTDLVTSGLARISEIAVYFALGAKSRRTMTPHSTGCNALHMLRNGSILRGHDWTRDPKLQLSIFYNMVNAMEVFSGGVNVARVFADSRVGEFERIGRTPRRSFSIGQLVRARYVVL